MSRAFPRWIWHAVCTRGVKSGLIVRVSERNRTQGTGAMIQTITRREYTVACDGCGITGPASKTAHEASCGVSALGWKSVTPILRFAFLTTWLCPDCQRRREELPRLNDQLARATGQE